MICPLAKSTSLIRRVYASIRRNPGLAQTQPGAVKQPDHQMCGTADMGDHFARLVDRQHHWQTLRPLRAHQILQPRQGLFQDDAIEEKQRAQRLILRGSTDVPIDRHMGQESIDLIGPHR